MNRQSLRRGGGWGVDWVGISNLHPDSGQAFRTDNSHTMEAENRFFLSHKIPSDTEYSEYFE